MDAKLKLVELLKNLPQVNHYEAEVQGLDYVFGCAAEFLIANGVTIPVRCKDCNNFVPESITVCRHCSLTGMQVVDEDDFCSYGERRTDE